MLNLPNVSFMSPVSFLGFIVEQGQLKRDPDKICAVLDWAVPNSWKQLQRFLSFAHFYRSFVKDYSRIVACGEG